MTIKSIVYNYRFLFADSGAKRYYPDYNHYMNLVSDSRIKTCALIGGEDYSVKIQTEYLKRCINYYILEARNYYELKRKIKKSFAIFSLASIERNIKIQIDENKWNKFFLLWMQRYYNCFLQDKAKQLGHRLLKALLDKKHFVI